VQRVTNESFEVRDRRASAGAQHLSGNNHGLTGGANLIGASNVRVASKHRGEERGGAVVLTGNLFWNNGVDQEAACPAPRSSPTRCSTPTSCLQPAARRSTAPRSSPSTASRSSTSAPATIAATRPIPALERDTGPPLQRSPACSSRTPAGHAQKGSKLKAASKASTSAQNDDVIAGLRFRGDRDPAGRRDRRPPRAGVRQEGPKPAALMIQGEASADAAPLGGAGDLAARAKTAAFASWNVALWPAAGHSDQTPELAPVLQEIVDEPGWDEGNAVTVLFTGTGKRSVAVLGSAPLLHVDFHYMVPMCPSDAL
jgi:hypothetical protein